MISIYRFKRSRGSLLNRAISEKTDKAMIIDSGANQLSRKQLLRHFDKKLSLLSVKMRLIQNRTLLNLHCSRVS